MQTRTSLGAGLALLLVGILGGCDSNEEQLVMRGDPTSVCVAAGEDGEAVILLDAVTNAGATPVTVEWIELVDAVNLDVVGREAEPELAPGTHEDLEITLRLYPDRDPPDQEGRATGVRVAYATGTSPDIRALNTHTEIRVLPPGGVCPPAA